MDAELGSAPVRLDAGSLSVAPLFQLHSEELLPEAPRPLEVVGGELDQLEHVGRLELLELDAGERGLAVAVSSCAANRRGPHHALSLGFVPLAGGFPDMKGGSTR